MLVLSRRAPCAQCTKTALSVPSRAARGVSIRCYFGLLLLVKSLCSTSQLLVCLTSLYLLAALRSRELLYKLYCNIKSQLMSGTREELV